MTDFLPGEDPWNAFEQNPAWDGAGDAERQQTDEIDEPETVLSGEVSHEVTFVQQAIQRVYHP
jgi:hypothetical protein